MLREISEEAGIQVKVKVVDILEVRKDTVYDYRLEKNITWLIISYICAHISGEFEICEPEKNLGYERELMREQRDITHKQSYLDLLS